MGTGRPSWLVVLGPRHHWWVVLVRCQLWVVLLGPHRFSWVEWLGAGCIVCGWWWCALIAPFVNGGGGAPSSVFMWHVTQGRGSWVICVCGCSICHCPTLASCIVSVCCHHVSLLLSHVPCCCHVSSPCRCPLPSLSLSCDVVVAVPSL